MSVSQLSYWLIASGWGLGAISRSSHKRDPESKKWRDHHRVREETWKPPIDWEFVASISSAAPANRYWLMTGSINIHKVSHNIWGPPLDMSWIHVWADACGCDCHALFVSRQRPHFHPCEWHVYQGRTIQQRDETLKVWNTGAAIRGWQSFGKKKWKWTQSLEFSLEPQVKHSGAQVKRLIKTWHRTQNCFFRIFFLIFFLKTKPCCSIFLPYIIMSSCVVFPLLRNLQQLILLYVFVSVPLVIVPPTGLVCEGLLRNESS